MAADCCVEQPIWEVGAENRLARSVHWEVTVPELERGWVTETMVEVVVLPKPQTEG